MGIVVLVARALLAAVFAVAGAALPTTLLTRRELLRRAGVHSHPEAAAVPEFGLPVGTPAPRFAMHDVDGVEVTLEGLLALQRPVVLVFTDPKCVVCEALMPEVAGWQS